MVGGDEWLARLLSLLLIGLATLFVHRAAASLGGRRAGALAAVLFVCQPLMFEYSLEIRPYSLQVLLVTIAMAAFAQTLVDLEQQRIRTVAGAARRLAPIVASGALATYTHSTTPAFLVTLSGAAAVYGLLRHNDRRFWLAWLVANGAVLLAITPHLRVMLDVIATNREGIGWIPSPTRFIWVYEVLRSLAVGQHSWGTVETKLVGASVIGAIGWSSWRLQDRPAHLVVGLVLPALGFTVLWTASLAQPILLPRTALWLVAPLCVLVGCASAELRWHRRRSWLIAGVLVASFTPASSSRGLRRGGKIG